MSRLELSADGLVPDEDAYRQTRFRSVAIDVLRSRMDGMIRIELGCGWCGSQER